LVHAGSADLTAHVDFADLAEVARARGAGVQGPIAQGTFLTTLGLFQRTEKLAAGRPLAQVAELMKAARRLAEPAAMGQLFKAMAVRSAACPALPGFVPPLHLIAISEHTALAEHGVQRRGRTGPETS
jgi:NADH dehydrogenase [ubiquinone] 1 alpha subcomplex assembly factor 7